MAGDQVPAEALTRDEALALITEFLGTPNPIRLQAFEFGWLAQEVLSEQQRALGMHVGLANFIIDRSGLITVHPSLPPRRIIAQYTAARLEGRIKGRQVWPRPEQPPTS